MNILFIWTGIPSYMLDCWRELASRPGINIKLFLEINRADEQFAEKQSQGLDCSFVYKGEPVNKDQVWQSIREFNPGLLVIVGWRAKISRFAATDGAFDKIPKLLAFDMIFEWRFRKLLAPLVLRPYLKRFQGAFVPGDRTAFYAKFLGFKSSNIHHGLFSVDTQKFRAAVQKRNAGKDYPRSFVFVGRYAREKRLDVLVAAYKLYRVKVDRPWSLNCYGAGTEGSVLEGVAGVLDCGYAEPSGMVGVYAKNGAFVLTSEYDPWPLVIAEAVASGLPVVCTEACGSHADLVRSYYNGVVCGTNDAESIAAGMLWVHRNEERIFEIGQRGIALVEPYSKEQWTEKFSAIAERYG
ncbi:MAG: glycosyltransferase family 4 protein [Kiritimatiellia bacterium]